MYSERLMRLCVLFRLTEWTAQHGVFVLNISLMSVLHLRLYTVCPLNLTQGITQAFKWSHVDCT
jgi:hypothetical protein